MNDPKDNEQILGQFAQLPAMELWNLADMRIQFTDDADHAVMQRFGDRRSLARAMTRWQEFYDRDRQDGFFVPDDPLWCSGLTPNATVEFVQQNYSGITDYVAWCRTCPPRHIWQRIGRHDLWTMVETTFRAAQARRVAIMDWRQINDALRHAAIRQHLGLEQEFEDLQDYVLPHVDQDTSIKSLSLAISTLVD